MHCNEIYAIGVLSETVLRSNLLTLRSGKDVLSQIRFIGKLFGLAA
jgi:hypothetical protein